MYHYIEITKREIIASITIIGFMLIVGMILSDWILDSIKDTNEVYNKAIHIENKDIFEYSMSTNVGNAFVYGDMIALNPVSYDDIEGEYMYIKRIKERYTRHERQVAYSCGKDNKSTCYRTEVYWTWDEVDREYKSTDTVTFLDVEFDFDQFTKPSTDHIATVKKSSHVRYKYYVTPNKLTGSIFADLRDNNIGSKVNFYSNKTTLQAYETVIQGYGLVYGFWIAWIVLTVGVVYGFYYLDNDWLY